MLLQGVLLGISLSFLIGPLLFSIVEAGISQGFRAGLAVAAGIWTSDVLFVLLLFYGLDMMQAFVSLPHFKFWVGISGSIILSAFGIGSLHKGLGGLKNLQKSETVSETQMTPKTYTWWYLRGLLLNTINPGTLFFWLGITSAVIVPSGWNRQEMFLFFGGMLTTLVITDTLKAWGAKALRRFLTPAHTRQIQAGIGILMLLFGCVLAIRSIIF